MFIQLGSLSLLIAVVSLLVSAICVFREYERGVVFFLGRFQKIAGPGFVLIIPAIQKVVRVDLRTIVLEVPTQDVISRDNVSVKVSAVVYFRITDAKNSIDRPGRYFQRAPSKAVTNQRVAASAASPKPGAGASAMPWISVSSLRQATSRKARRAPLMSASSSLSTSASSGDSSACR